MNLIQFFRLIIRNSKILLAVPIVIAITIFFATKESPEKYVSQTSIYTGLASGYSVENGEGSKVDFNSIIIAFDNIINVIKSRETKEEVALRLLAKHICLESKANKSISQAHLNRLSEILPKNVIAEVLVPNSEEKTFDKLLKFKNSNEDNLIYKLINNEQEPYYSIHAINEIKVSRVQASDIIQLTFEADDPGICKDVLDLVSTTFIKNFKHLKRGETSSVVDFFEKQTALAFQKLNAAEENLKLFKTENKIINYDEQTKFISEKHENIIDERNKEKMELVAAESSINKINEKLGSAQKSLKLNGEILNLRNELSSINTEILLLNTDENPKSLQKQIKLNSKAADLKNKLDDKVENLFTTTTSKEGVAHKDLAKMWVDNVLKADESKAKLSIYGQRMNEIDRNYDVFAPLGSNISKMEREIDIAEKEYLSHLASLNAARLREQNLQLSSNLQVIDSAYFPVDALPNKRKLVLIAGTIAGFALVLIILVVTEILDQTIKTVERAKNFLQTAVISGLPEQKKSTEFLNSNGTVEKLTKMACSKIVQYLREKPKTELPFVVSIVSTKVNEQKTYVGEKLASYFSKLNKKVLFITPSETNSELNNICTVLKYTPEMTYMEAENIGDLVNNSFNKVDFDIIFIEFPAFCEQKTPVGILNECDLSILCLRTDRIWDEADQNSFEYFKDSYSKTIFSFLTNMSVYNLEAFIGEIPRKRGFIRKTLKKWIQFDFTSK
jgi:uncharacterized protein involved in exopolysaccharide biosynthesis